MGKLLAIVLTLVVVVAIAGLLYRPATVIGVSDKSLASSIRSTVDTNKSGPCKERDADRFTCAVFDADSSGPVIYGVDIGDYGCWDATAVGSGNDSRPGTLSGCITIVDLARGED